MRTIATLLVTGMLCAAPVSAQTLAPFTAEDMLDVTTLAILDLSEDGRWVAATTRRLRDNATTDHRRFGDPGYVAPASLDLLVIESATGDISRPFASRMNIRQAAFSRDGRRLAILTAAEDAEGLPITSLHMWDTDRRALAAVPLAGDAQVSAASDLIWRPDGSALFVTLRTRAQDREAHAAFRTQVDGPVVVHSSEDPFLEWDAFRREDRTRRLVSLDPATGRVTEVLPEARLTSFRLARDGSFVTVLEDVTEKTDYDVIFGTHNAVKHLPLPAGASAPARTLVDAKTLKTTTPRWSDDGRVMAWADKGEVFERAFDAVRNAMNEMEGHEETELFRSVSRPDSYLIVSRWQSRERFETFIRSEQFRKVTTWGQDQVLAERPRHEVYEHARPTSGEVPPGP